MVRTFNSNSPQPRFVNWKHEQHKYKGWNLIFSDQCPWHDKSVNDLKQSALDNGIELNVIKLNTPEEAQNSPSGFGTLSLIKDGKLLGDHYLSRTRFENILRQEMKILNAE